MTSKVKIIFLGTSGAIPSAEKNATSILLTYEGENILVDCGEGTQRQIRKAKLNPCKITKILITHWHGDHILGIPGLLQTLALSGYNKKLEIYGPRGTKKFMKEMLNVFVFVNKLDLKIEEVSGKFFENNDFYLEAEKMTHGTYCNAYKFVKKEKIRIDKKKLLKSHLPAGPLVQKLKQGKDIFYNGKKFKAKNLTYLEDGKKVSFILDTSMNNKIVSFVNGSDLLISEASFLSDLEEQAKEYGHLTSKQAGEIAKKAKVKKLILTHVSQRYDKNLKAILDDAKKPFNNTELARDLMEVNV
jgi:ribonuclease Z